VQFEEKRLSDLKSLELSVPAGLPKIDFVEPFQAGQEVEPIPIRYSDEETHILSYGQIKHQPNSMPCLVDFKTNLGACYSGIVVMLYFKPFDLRLRQNEHGEHVIEQCGTVTRTFSSEKKAVAYFHRVRDELEKSLPPRMGLSDVERRELLDKYLADNPTPRNSLNENAAKKPSKSRRFG
jgi:hypothetical protein